MTSCQHLTDGLRNAKSALSMHDAADVLFLFCAMVNDNVSQQ